MKNIQVSCPVAVPDSGSVSCRVYHSREGKFMIEPFEYRFPQRITEWLHKSDDYVRNNFSTSPAVEPSHFSQEMKQVFQFVAQNPFPMHSVFKSKMPLEFHLSPSTGQWCSIWKELRPSSVLTVCRLSLSISEISPRPLWDHNRSYSSTNIFVQRHLFSADSKQNDSVIFQRIFTGQ